MNAACLEPIGVMPIKDPGSRILAKQAQARRKLLGTYVVIDFPNNLGKSENLNLGWRGEDLSKRCRHLRAQAGPGPSQARIQHPESKILDQGSWIQDPGFRILDSGSGILHRNFRHGLFQHGSARKYSARISFGVDRHRTARNIHGFGKNLSKIGSSPC